MISLYSLLPLLTLFLKRNLARISVAIMIPMIVTNSFADDDPLPTELTILSYHEIADKTDTLDPTYSVTPTNFVRQMDWLKNHNYHFVSVDDLLAHRTGKKILPPNPVLITFDDGYHSVYTHAYPILKMFNAPAVIALVGSWLEPKSGRVDFDGRSVDRSELLSQAEIKEMVQSGLVELASHTYGLHKGIVSNPQGNKEPAATARQWLADKQRYENEQEYAKRVELDIQKNQLFIKQYTGQTPRIMVWPYGRYNIEARKIAEKSGMPIGLTLDDGPNTLNTPLFGLRRILVDRTMTLNDISNEIDKRNANYVDDARPSKIAHIDLDYIYDPDPVQTEKNLGLLLERIVAMGVNTVYLQAFADPDANGAADAVYFPNRHVPMRSDLFNRVAWQISTRTQVKRLYAWMPLLAWQLPASEPAAKDVVVTLPKVSEDGTVAHLAMGYPRLSPFSPRVKQTLLDIYQDLGRSTPIDGVLFHDDVTLSDYEDNSPQALATYAAWGLSPTVEAIRQSEDQRTRWTILKINALDNLAMDMAQIVRDEQPGLKTARNLYANVALNPRSEEWYAQSLQNSLANYDYTAIMAMPYMEQATDHKAFYQKIVDNVKSYPNGVDKVVMELQTVDWRHDDKPLPSQEIADTMKSLYRMGVEHIAYYPDNMFKNNPDPAMIKPVFASKETTIESAKDLKK